MSNGRFREGNWREDRKALSRAPEADDLRRHPRFAVDGAGATVVQKGFLGFLGMGRASRALMLLNLSEGGALILSNEAVPKGKRVRLRVEMAKYRDRIEADGVVCWCTRSRQRDREYHLAIEFSSLPESQARRLTQMREWFTSPEFLAKSKARSKQTRTIEFFR